MEILWNVMIVVHVIAALGIIGLVLVQHGKGADMGAAFGSGSSGSLFGATGSANFLSRATAILAAVFFLTSLGMAYVATHKPRASGAGVMEGIKSTVPAPATPAVPSPSAIPGQDAPKGAGAASVPAAPNVQSDGTKSNQIPK